MKHTMKKIMLVLILCLSLPILVLGAERPVVKVGYFRIGPYFQIDAKGNVQGYETDWLQEISRYTGTKFEYVDCGTWLHGADMLNTGEIDLLGLSLWNPAREEQYEFCLSGYGYNVSEIVTLPDNQAGYQDYEAIGKMKLGIRFNYVPKENLLARLAKQGQHPEVVIFRTQKELMDALYEGRVDAVGTTSHLIDQDLKVLDKFEYTPFYFMAKKGNTELTDKIDTALAEININNPSFDDDLLKKYFPGLNQYPLSKEEEAYLKSLGSLTFAYCNNEGYLSRTENGKYVGIHPALAKKLCELLGVTYKEVQFDYPQLVKRLSAIQNSQETGAVLRKEIAAKGIDVWGDFYYDLDWADKLGVSTSDAYLESTYYEIRQKGEAVNARTDRIALVRGLRFVYDVANRYEPERIVWCDNYESCIKAVKDGAAEFTVVNTRAAEYYLSMFRYSDLAVKLISFENKTAFAIIDKNKTLLRSAINKKILALSQEEKREIIQQETLKLPEQNIFMAFIYTHTVTAILLFAAFVGSIIMLAFMYYTLRRNQKQNEMLQKATNAKSEFLAKMSHDMRTPMNAIINLTNMVTDEIDNKGMALADLKKIKISNEFLLSLINDVLDVSRIEQGKMVLNRQVYNAADFIDYMHATFDELCKKKNIAFSVVTGALSTAVVVDRVRFNQLCFNLVSNSVKYTNEGGWVSLKLIYGDEEKGYIPTDIYVEDNGIGMSKEFVNKAFGQFVQENRQFSAVEGAGLGLSIVQEIVKLMGGTIEIDTQINKGTRIHIHLQLEKATAEMLEAEAKLHEEAKVNLRVLEGKTALVVEDHVINMQIAVRLLEKKGMKVLTATNGEEGVQVYTKQADMIDIIMMDIRMPIMNGLEAAEAIRKLPMAKAQKVMIVAMTANAYQEDVEASIAAGMNAHIAKPIVPKILYETIARLLQ